VIIRRFGRIDDAILAQDRGDQATVTERGHEAE
jgi:hypothetical protein